jgi:hypothetical protein
MVKGTILEVLSEAKEGGSGHKTTYIVASYNLGANSKRKKLLLKLVKLKDATTETEQQPAAVAPQTQAAESNLPNTPLNPTTIAEIITTAIATTNTTTTHATIQTSPIIVANTPDTVSTTTTAATARSQETPPTVKAHGENWYTNPIAITHDITGVVYTRSWGVKNLFNKVFHKGSYFDIDLSQLEVFNLMFPPAQINVIICKTNNVLIARNNWCTLLTH